MYRLRKNFRFESSHQLMHHDGKCKRLHGHSWNGFIEVAGESLFPDGPKQNMLVDYADLGKVTKAMEARLDHQHLNDILQSEMPTSEYLAKWIADEIRGQGFSNLFRVCIMETCTSRCDYFPA